VVSEARVTKAGEIEFTLRPGRGSRPICGSCGNHQQTFSYRLFLATPPQVPDIGVPTRPRIQKTALRSQRSDRGKPEWILRPFGLHSDRGDRAGRSRIEPMQNKTNPQILLARQDFDIANDARTDTNIQILSSSGLDTCPVDRRRAAGDG